MYPTFKALAGPGVAACVLATAMACSTAPDSPAAPSSVTSDVTDAAADGSTLKVTAPAPVSPKGDIRLDTRKPVMTATNATGRFAGGTYTYEFQLMNDARTVINSATINAGFGSTIWVYPTELDRDTPYRWRVRARMGLAVGPWSSEARFVTVKENRTPNPPPGGKLPLPNMQHIVSQVIAQNPGILSGSRSCQDAAHGGNPVTGWEFLDKVVDTLRLTDTRWGYNGKRGNANDPSTDIVAYNWGRNPDEGTTDVYIIDILLGHCGASPSPTWIDQTQLTLNSGTIGRWTSRGRFPGSQGIQ